MNCRISAEALGLSEEQAAEWEENTEREFAFWAESKDCDITRSMNFYELQHLCFKSVLLNGDALVMLPMRTTKNFPYDLRIALIEGDRLQNPPLQTYDIMIDGGVEFDRDGKPVAYHIANKHPLSEISGEPPLKYVRVPAFGEHTGRRNVLHLLPMERIGQHRGVPFLAPVIETLKQLGRYSDAELMAAVIGGIFAIFFEHGVDDDDISDFVGEEAMASDLGLHELKEEKFKEWQEGLKTVGMDDMYGMIADLPERTRAKSVSSSRQNTVCNLYARVRAAHMVYGSPAAEVHLY